MAKPVEFEAIASLLGQPWLAPLSWNSSLCIKTLKTLLDMYQYMHHPYEVYSLNVTSKLTTSLNPTLVQITSFPDIMVFRKPLGSKFLKLS